MPVHDWTRVRAGTFHFFHQRWIAALCDALNLGGLPDGYFAMSEVDAGGDNLFGYAGRSDRVSVYREQRELIATIEIVPAGIKRSETSTKAYVRNSVELLRRGVHHFVADLFPPLSTGSRSIPSLIWKDIRGHSFALPADKPLTLASYSAGEEKVADVELIAVGDSLPDMPLFLSPDRYIPCPLEAAYQATWAVFPAALRGPLTA